MQHRFHGLDTGRQHQRDGSASATSVVQRLAVDATVIASHEEVPLVRQGGRQRAHLRQRVLRRLRAAEQRHARLCEVVQVAAIKEVIGEALLRQAFGEQIGVGGVHPRDDTDTARGQPREGGLLHGHIEAGCQHLCRLGRGETQLLGDLCRSKIKERRQRLSLGDTPPMDHAFGHLALDMAGVEERQPKSSFMVGIHTSLTIMSRVVCCDAVRQYPDYRSRRTELPRLPFA